MKLRLDDIDLIKRIDKDGAIEEVRSIASLSVSGRRRIVELEIPGSRSNVFQDLGRRPLRSILEGELTGPGTKNTLEDLKSKFELGKPVPFSSDITTISDVTEVVIEDFSVGFENVLSSSSRYSMTLREHWAAPGPGETQPPSLQEAARAEVERKAKQVFSGLRSIQR